MQLQAPYLICSLPPLCEAGAVERGLPVSGGWQVYAMVGEEDVTKQACETCWRPVWMAAISIGIPHR